MTVSIPFVITLIDLFGAFIIFFGLIQLGLIILGQTFCLSLIDLLVFQGQLSVIVPLLGQGLGTTTTSEGTYENTIAADLPHNEYVRYLVETGTIGMAILLYGLVIVMRGLARRRKIADIHNAAVLAISVVAGCLVSALTANTFLNSTTGYAVVLIMASVLSVPIAAASTARGRHHSGA